MGQILKILIVILFFLFLGSFIRAANPVDIVINEIAWMGTIVSYNDEWIELYNNSDSTINLEGWILRAADGAPEIKLTGEISINGFYLLERTDDSTLPEIPADQIYTGALNNEGEKLELYDNFGNLIDSVDCSSGWFAGDNKTKQTMEMKDPKLPGSHPGSWQTSQSPGGTPKAKNSKPTEEVVKEAIENNPQQTEVGPPETPEASEKPATTSLSYQDSRSDNFGAGLIAISVAIFSAIAVLLLKNKIKKVYNQNI